MENVELEVWQKKTVSRIPFRNIREARSKAIVLFGFDDYTFIKSYVTIYRELKKTGESLFYFSRDYVLKLKRL